MTADLRIVHADGVSYVALVDVGALLLDAAISVEQTPDLSAADVLRSIAEGIGAYAGPTGDQ